MSLLEIQKVSINFGGLVALDSVSLNVDKGTICAVIGPNGAGKSTLFNCVNGLYKVNSGHIVFEGQNITGLPTYQISKCGIARTFQNLELFSNMTAIENVMVGYHAHIKTNLFTEALRVGKFFRQEDHFYARALEIMNLLKIVQFKDFVISELPYGTLKRVEIGRALAMNPTLLLLDEPTSGMNEQETEEIAELILELNDEQDISILLVEHDMSVVMGLSDIIYVLNYAKVIAKGSAEEVKNDPEVIRAFLGGE